MDLISQARCHLCEKIFCCPEHRRSHELLVHPKKNKKMLQPPFVRKQSESYALEMRKRLYSEQNRMNFHRSRKRKYLTVSEIEQEEFEVKVINRKILVPLRKRMEMDELSKKGDKTEIDGGAEIDGDEIISPIESKKGQDGGIIFTTSTPLIKRGQVLTSFPPKSRDNQFPSPLESIIEDIPGFVHGDHRDRIQITTSYQKRKVTFSESVESVYDTAAEPTSPETRPGIFATVANVFQAALQRIPGVGEVREETYAVPSSPGGSKKKRASREFLKGQFRIKGRRPLRQGHRLLSPEY